MNLLLTFSLVFREPTLNHKLCVFCEYIVFRWVCITPASPPPAQPCEMLTNAPECRSQLKPLSTTACWWVGHWELPWLARAPCPAHKEVLVGSYPLWAAKPPSSGVLLGWAWPSGLSIAVGRREEEPGRGSWARQEPRLQPWRCLCLPGQLYLCPCPPAASSICRVLHVLVPRGARPQVTIACSF